MARASSGEPQLPSRLDESEWILGCKMLRGVSIHNFEGDAPGPPGILSLRVPIEVTIATIIITIIFPIQHGP